MNKEAEALSDPIESMIAKEAAVLIANDALKHPLPGTKLNGSKAPELDHLDDDILASAHAELAAEISQTDLLKHTEEFVATLENESSATNLPFSMTLSTTNPTAYSSAFATATSHLLSLASTGNKLEKKLALHLGGYQARAKTLRSKIVEASEAVEKARVVLDGFETLRVGEEAALGRRLEGLREEVAVVSRREREIQDVYREVREELRELEARGEGRVNGVVH